MPNLQNFREFWSSKRTGPFCRRGRIARVALIVATLLVIPLLGNQFVEGWNWSPSDFVVMGAIVFITGVMLDVGWRKAGKHRLIAVATIVVLFCGCGRSFLSASSPTGAAKHRPCMGTGVWCAMESFVSPIMTTGSRPDIGMERL